MSLPASTISFMPRLYPKLAMVWTNTLLASLSTSSIGYKESSKSNVNKPSVFVF